MSARIRVWLACLCLLFTPLAGAALSWEALSTEEKRALAPHREDWDKLDAATQAQLRSGAQAWLSMSSEQRVAAAERFTRWQQLDAQQRAALRERFEAFRQLPSDERQRLRQSFQRFQGLPKHRQMELLQRFKRMSPGEREAFMLALRAQGEAERGRRFWSFVPPEERADTVKMMQSLSPMQRRALRQRARGMNMQQGQALRRQLLAMTPEQRATFLGTR